MGTKDSGTKMRGFCSQGTRGREVALELGYHGCTDSSARPTEWLEGEAKDDDRRAERLSSICMVATFEPFLCGSTRRMEVP